MQTRLGYDVNLTDLENPIGELFISHSNGADADVPCIQWDATNEITGESTYPIDRCYWDYMRFCFEINFRVGRSASVRIGLFGNREF